MKRRKWMLVLMITFVFSEATQACDICGCGVGSYYLGILPEFRKRFFGMRYQYKSLLTHVSPGGGRSYLTTTERYTTAELWGAWNIGSKFRVIGFVPLNFVEKTNQGVTNKKNGIGDVAVIGYYNVFNTAHTTDSFKMVVQSLWIGGGVKAPTGHYDPLDEGTSIGELNTYQLGTGSVDFTLNAAYDLRIQDAGVNANASYKINTANKYGYTYGNKLTANLLGYYKFRVAKNLSLSPNAGVLYEKASADLRSTQHKVEDSGGYGLMGTAGVEVSIKRIGFGANYQTPLSQDLAMGMVKAGNRAMVHLSFSF